MKFGYLLAVIALIISGSLVLQSIEHSHLTRGFNCEAVYLQARVDTAKTIDDLTKILKTKKGSEGTVEFLESVKNYQLFVANMPGENSKCVNIEKTTLEIIYFNIREGLK